MGFDLADDPAIQLDGEAIFAVLHPLRHCRPGFVHGLGAHTFKTMGLGPAEICKYIRRVLHPKRPQSQSFRFDHGLDLQKNFIHCTSTRQGMQEHILR